VTIVNGQIKSNRHAPGEAGQTHVKQERKACMQAAWQAGSTTGKQEDRFAID